MNIKRFEFNLFGENTYIIWDEASREAAIVDPGMSSPAEEKTLDDFISKEKLSLKAILLTHIHIDHTFGVDHIKEIYNAPIYASKEDEYLGKRRIEQARMFHIPMELSPIDIDHPVTEGEILRLGQEPVLALHAPGHSLGSTLYYLPMSKALLSGDVLFQGSIGRTDLPGGDYATLIKSIHQQILELPATTKVYPGHGPSTTIADEMRFNPYI